MELDTQKLLMLVLTVVGIALCTFGCKQNSANAHERPAGAEIAVRWELVANNIGGHNRYRVRLWIHNRGTSPLPATGWTIYFNQLSGAVAPESLSQGFSIARISGDFYSLKPTSLFKPVPPGSFVDVTADFAGLWINQSDAPQGLYIVFDTTDGGESRPEIIVDYTITPVPMEMAVRGKKDQVPLATPAWQYAQNEKVTAMAYNEVQKVIPTPERTIDGSMLVTIDSTWQVRYEGELEQETTYLTDSLENHFGVQLKIGQGLEQGGKIILLTKSPQSGKSEAYSLRIDRASGIHVDGHDAAGVFYGIQTLLALVPPPMFERERESVPLQEVSISDAPRFSYRGLHLDVARNFQSKESVLKLLDIMAFYKLNKLHFHVTDDEGWRLEIPSMPSLTEIGSKRGHTSDELEMLRPAYGSGPYPNAKLSSGSGYYTKSGFVEILRKATSRHIDVILEIDTPGHSRAAIKAMFSRYPILLEAGRKDEAESVLLSDPKDRSRYESVQGYSDNVICVCRESVYRFWEIMIDDIKKMYDEANAPLRTIHIGGDEVPPGVWEKSPSCKKLRRKNRRVRDAEDLMSYYILRVGELMKRRGITVSVWQEAALRRSGGHYVPNADLIHTGLVAYFWNNLSDNADIGNRLGNAGFPVVLCNVTNLYFDLAYSKDPREPGAYWGGFVDTRKVYSFIPEDVLKSNDADPLGNRYDKGVYGNSERLTPSGYANVLGIQAQVWSVTIKGKEMLDYFLLPKLLGVAERAWAAQPAWAMVDDPLERDLALDQAWSVFANSVGQRELPRLVRAFGGWHYRIAPPGAIVVKGVLLANSDFPGLTIRYTTDSTDPKLDSLIYEKPVRVNGPVKLRTFDVGGRGSEIAFVGP